jgi:putative phosphoesterase
MRIAIILDIHGNFESLSALTEPYDELWVLADLVNYGPDPGPVIDFVRSHATVVVQGNHDHAVGLNEDPRCSPPYREMAKETMQFTRSVLSRDQIEYLAGLPLVVERTVEQTKFVLCHAAPSGPLYNYVPANSPRWKREMELVSTDFLLVGHTHTPFVQAVGVSLVINPGSLGQPKTGATKACYAIWKRGRSPICGLRTRAHAEQDRQDAGFNPRKRGFESRASYRRFVDVIGSAPPRADGTVNQEQQFMARRPCPLMSARAMRTTNERLVSPRLLATAHPTNRTLRPTPASERRSRLRELPAIARTLLPRYLGGVNAGVSLARTY